MATSPQTHELALVRSNKAVEIVMREGAVGMSDQIESSKDEASRASHGEQEVALPSGASASVDDGDGADARPEQPAPLVQPGDFSFSLPPGVRAPRHIPKPHWTEDENILLLKLYDEAEKDDEGRVRWSEMVKHFPVRKPGAIMKHWEILDQRVKEGQENPTRASVRAERSRTSSMELDFRTAEPDPVDVEPQSPDQPPVSTYVPFFDSLTLDTVPVRLTTASSRSIDAPTSTVPLNDVPSATRPKVSSSLKMLLNESESSLTSTTPAAIEIHPSASFLRQKATHRPWTKEEDELLRKVRAEKFKTGGWAAVRPYFPSRSLGAVMQRWMIAQPKKAVGTSFESLPASPKSPTIGVDVAQGQQATAEGSSTSAIETPDTAPVDSTAALPPPSPTLSHLSPKRPPTLELTPPPSPPRHLKRGFLTSSFAGRPPSSPRLGRKPPPPRLASTSLVHSAGNRPIKPLPSPLRSLLRISSTPSSNGSSGTDDDASPNLNAGSRSQTRSRSSTPHVRSPSLPLMSVPEPEQGLPPSLSEEAPTRFWEDGSVDVYGLREFSPGLGIQLGKPVVEREVEKGGQGGKKVEWLQWSGSGGRWEVVRELQRGER
ncbi:Dot6p [Pseudohyphozyma bogoriensis]|nr:Dot6p [Pseudohyphozyma bogoriensis]